MVWHVFEFADQLGKQLRTFADDFLEIGGDLSGESQEDIRILLEFFGQRFGGLFGGSLFEASFKLAQVRRLYADASCQLPQGEGVAFACLEGQAARTDEMAKGVFDDV